MDHLIFVKKPEIFRSTNMITRNERKRILILPIPENKKINLNQLLHPIKIDSKFIKTFLKYKKERTDENIVQELCRIVYLTKNSVKSAYFLGEITDIINDDLMSEKERVKSIEDIIFDGLPLIIQNLKSYEGDIEEFKDSIGSFIEEILKTMEIINIKWFEEDKNLFLEKIEDIKEQIYNVCSVY